MALGLITFGLLVSLPSALAAPPNHIHNSGLDISGFDAACGTAVDSKGNVYVASAGESKIRIFSSAHLELGFVENTHEPCSLAVNRKGELLVSEKAVGEVVRYTPATYPFVGSPEYAGPELVDGSGDAKGVAIDTHDDRIYVAEGNRIAVYRADGSFEASVGEGVLTEATGVAAYSYVVSVTKSSEGEVLFEKFDRHLFVADAAGAKPDRIDIFDGRATLGEPSVDSLKLHREVIGPRGGAPLSFGSAGAYLAADSGNGNEEGKCTSIAEQACTAGHFFVYDVMQNAVEEFDASGEYLDQFTTEALADAKPTAIAVDRSGDVNDGRIYVTSSGSSGAELLTFDPLPAPSRTPLPDLSHALNTPTVVATDSHGTVYVVAGALIQVFDATGREIKVGPEGKGIPDSNFPGDLAVDSEGRMYVVDQGKGFQGESIVTYYTPSEYPPTDGTKYTRHEPPIVTSANLGGDPEAIAIDPGNDHLSAISQDGDHTIELDSVMNGSGFIGYFAPTLSFGSHPRGIDIFGGTGSTYVSEQVGFISVVDNDGDERVAQFTGAGSPLGKFKFSVSIAVDQSNGHVLTFDERRTTAHEYDASGGFVSDFGELSEEGVYDIAVDSSCAIHRNSLGKLEPLTESTAPTCKQFDPADGNAYVVTASAVSSKYPTNLTAFGPLEYGGPPLATTGTASGISAGSAILNGTVNPRSFGLIDCRFEYLLDSEYLVNINAHNPAFEGAETHACVETLPQIGKGNAAVGVHASVGGLVPEGRYRFRLVAENKYSFINDGSSEGAPVLFGPPVIAAKPALPVLYTEASLRANIDPSGLVTKYHFDYGLNTGEYDQSTPIEELSGAAGPSDVQAVLTGLGEGTTFHFRVVAENESKTVTGPDQVFETLLRRPQEACENNEYRTGLSTNLPDCRVYELVTPPETNGLSPGAADVFSSGSGEAGFNNWLATPRGPGIGEQVSYFTAGTLPGFDGNGFSDGYRTVRAIDEGPHPRTGWKSTLFAPTYKESAADFFHPPAQQSIASDELYSFWLIDPSQIFEGTLPGGVYLATPGVVAGSPCNPQPLQADFELVGCGSLGTDPNAEGRFVSPGGAHVIFRSKAHLEGSAAPPGTEAVYDRRAGSKAARVVSLEPDGSAFGAGENAAYVASTENGSAIVFRVGGALYLRPEGKDAIKVADGPTNTFTGLSEDGTRVFFAKAASGDNPADLFVCDTQAGPCTGSGTLAGLVEIAKKSIFVGVSADGSVAFFTSEEALPGLASNENGEKPEVTKHNLYSWDLKTLTTHFLAILDSKDFESFDGNVLMTLSSWATAINPGPNIGRANAPIRATPDGRVFVFQSHAQLTLYDNGGKSEVYRYDPAAPNGQRLICISCDPSNAPASADALLEDTSTGTGVRWDTVIANLTDDGQHVFFQSRDRLLPEDANDAKDVYEWTARGAGDAACQRQGGCLALISTGQGEGDSFLYGMSADGHDVFFRTSEKLVGSDVAGSPSIYDARVGGGIPEAQVKRDCQGDACQGNGTATPVLPAPATTGNGNGNVKSSKPRCAKGRHRVKGRCVKKPRKAHKRHRSHHKRGSGK